MTEKDLQIRIVHISDTHISPFGGFEEKIFDKAVSQINVLDPPHDILIHTGDLTDNGVLSDYEFALEKIASIEGRPIIVPGNHDERNYGQSLFRELIGDLDREVDVGKAKIFALNSPEPDRNEGRLGRRRQAYLDRKLSETPENTIKIVAFHHHLVPVPHSGREINVLEDAGDVINHVLKYKVNLIFMGHRHVGRILRIEDTILINTGTTSSIRTRGRLGHTFNIIDVMKNGVTKIYERNIPRLKTILKAEYAPTIRP
jgi:3',5'-cyclic AMP phosphodiesterase CpdA